MNQEIRMKVSHKIQCLLQCSNQRANNIEKWVHNRYVNGTYTRSGYTRKCRSILWNVERSEILRNQLSGKHIDYEFVFNQKPWDIMPELWQETLDRHYQKHINKYVNDKDVGMYPCHKCKSMNTKHVQVQTRSADEPMTLYITCMECGKVTKM